MRGSAAELGDFDSGFEGGAEGFLFKGTNGRWRDVLGDDELELYRRTVATRLPADAASWIETGGPA
jgi:aryl sulfotransferase